MDFNLLKRFEGAKILVAGEIGIDEYIWGDTRRISPEAPVPIVEVDSQSLKLGLTANVAHNTMTLGAQPLLVSIRGRDADGERLSKMMVESGLKSSVLIEDTTRPTLRKVRIIAQKQHIVRVDYERSHPLEPKVAKAFCEAISDQLDQYDAVIVEDYGKGIWTEATMAFVKKARQTKKPVYVDPSRCNPLSLYRGVTLLSPNVLEAEALCGSANSYSKLTGKDDERLTKLATQILEQTSADHAVITCGEYGMVSTSKSSTGLTRIPTFAREVFDVTGAGDTVISVLALTHVVGEPLSRCMQVANAAAGIVVGRMGASSVTPQELCQELERLVSTGIIRD